MATLTKIAFICHPYHRGGVTRWMADAAISYAESGVEVYFVTVQPLKEFYSGRGRETMVQLLAKSTAPVKVIKTDVSPLFEFSTPAYIAGTYRQLLGRVPPGTPVILSDDKTVWAAAASLHGAYPLVGVLHADDAAYYTLAKEYYQQVPLMVCVSQRVKATTAAMLPQLAPDTLHTIPCGIHLPAIAPYAPAGSATLQLVYVGRIDEHQKRTGDLAKIGAALAKEGIPFHLTIIGDGGEARVKLEQEVKQERLEGNITFAGWVSQQEVAARLAAADMMVMASNFEGTPIAMMEALAAGCGFVGTRVSGIEDYEHNPLAAECFAVFEVGDIPGAVAAIKRIAGVPAPARRQAARRLAEGQFSMQVCLQRYSAAIAQIKHMPATPASIKLSMADRLASWLTANARLVKMKMR